MEPTNIPPPPPPAPSRQVFAIFGTDQQQKIAELVQKEFAEDDRYELPSGDWLVAANLTQASKLYDRLVGENPTQISVIVCRMDRFYGLHDSAIWDWVASSKNGSDN